MSRQNPVVAPAKSTKPSAIWPDCGYHTLTPAPDNYLQITESFLRHLFMRPELVPIETSCAHERDLHQALLDDPKRIVSADELQALADPDARENYQFILGFRDVLLNYGTIEGAYLALSGGRAGHSVPPSLMNLLVQIQLQHILQNDADPFKWRMAEIFFRPQKVSVDSGVLLADAEVLESRRQTGDANILQMLIRQAQGESAGIREHLSVLTLDNAERFWAQRECFSFAVSLTRSEPGLAALCCLLQAWLDHFYKLAVHVEPIERIEPGDWQWHIGLDADSNRILNALYQGETVDDDTLRCILALFTMEFADAHALRPEMAGHPVQLGVAMSNEHWLRFKPQNLLLNLPLAELN